MSYVQIDVPETLSIEGRAAFFESTGDVPRHGRHAPLPAHGRRRDGAADVARRAAAARRDGQGLRVDAAVDPEAVVRGQYDGYRRRARRRPQRRRPRRSSRCAPRSTTGAGRACRSTCAPASASQQGRQVVTIGLARADDADLPARGRGARPAAGTGSSSTSPTPGRSTCDFLAKLPGAADATRRGAR